MADVLSPGYRCARSFAPVHGFALSGGYRFDETLDLLRRELIRLQKEEYAAQVDARRRGSRRWITRAVDRNALIAELMVWVIDRANAVEAQNTALNTQPTP